MWFTYFWSRTSFIFPDRVRTSSLIEEKHMLNSLFDLFHWPFYEPVRCWKLLSSWVVSDLNLLRGYLFIRCFEPICSCYLSVFLHKVFSMAEWRVFCSSSKLVPSIHFTTGIWCVDWLSLFLLYLELANSCDSNLFRVDLACARMFIGVVWCCEKPINPRCRRSWKLVWSLLAYAVAPSEIVMLMGTWAMHSGDTP